MWVGQCQGKPSSFFPVQLALRSSLASAVTTPFMVQCLNDLPTVDFPLHHTGGFFFMALGSTEIPSFGAEILIEPLPSDLTSWPCEASWGPQRFHPMEYDRTMMLAPLSWFITKVSCGDGGWEPREFLGRCALWNMESMLLRMRNHVERHDIMVIFPKMCTAKDIMGYLMGIVSNLIVCALLVCLEIRILPWFLAMKHAKHAVSSPAIALDPTVEWPWSASNSPDTGRTWPIGLPLWFTYNRMEQPWWQVRKQTHKKNSGIAISSITQLKHGEAGYERRAPYL